MNNPKQINLTVFNAFIFEHCIDLSGEIIVHTYKDYKTEDLLLATSEFVYFFTKTKLPEIKKFIGFTNLKYIIN